MSQNDAHSDLKEHIHHCPVVQEWAATTSKIDSIHSMMVVISKNIEHLAKLDTIATTLNNFTERLLDAATDKNKERANLVSRIATMCLIGLVVMVLIVLIRDSGYSLKGSHDGFFFQAPQCAYSK